MLCRKTGILVILQTITGCWHSVRKCCLSDFVSCRCFLLLRTTKTDSLSIFSNRACSAVFWHASQQVAFLDPIPKETSEWSADVFPNSFPGYTPAIAPEDSNLNTTILPVWDREWSVIILPSGKKEVFLSFVLARGALLTVSVLMLQHHITWDWLLKNALNISYFLLHTCAIWCFLWSYYFPLATTYPSLWNH